MSVKTITITEQAYKTLKAKKGRQDSFSDVILRIAGSRSLDEFYGALSPASTRKLETALQEARAVRNRRHAKRIERIRKELS